ncbi:Signal peptidase complex subunit 3 [Thelohanellus kitauei]|uniref:Signal peptidase complex subunit 3 n=1 Tax=Thelohanellus kitauei TaxID=669202 RepID=A0A0C2M8D4_THEKT|nr:Signal peptidase complex subunit 3 [Thelohanellus kitauei]
MPRRQIRNPSISYSLIHGADFKFHLDIGTSYIDPDVSPVFHWNNKQVFLKLIAYYSTEAHPSNEFTVWDRIILRTHAQKLSLKNQPTKYTLEDHGTGLLNNTVKFKLHIEMIPYVGFMKVVVLHEQPAVKILDRFTGSEYVRL